MEERNRKWSIDMRYCQNTSMGHHIITDTWLVVPVFNEAEVVADVITEARKTFPHVVCVDDGSSDESASEALRAGATVVVHPVNLGQGAALQTGFDYIRDFTDAAYVVTFDADGQHDPNDAAAMVSRARAEGLGFVFGSRFMDRRTRPGFAKRVVLGIAVVGTRLTTGLDLTDAHNGLRLIRRDALERIALNQHGMAHASEIVAALAATGLPWAEHPVHIRYTEYSRAKGQSLLNSVNILADLILK